MGDFDNVAEPGDKAAEYEMADFTVGPLEIFCNDCHLIHRPGQCW
jgi:hypothetical protein